MANSATPLIPVDGVLTITDNTPTTPLSYVLQYEDGDFQVGSLNNSQKTRESFTSRGKTYSVRDVEDQNIEFSFTCHAVHIIGDGTIATIGDVVLQAGAWSAAISMLPVANGDSYLLQVGWTGERSNFGATADNSITLKYCALDIDFAEGVPGKLSIKGTAHCISTDYLTIA